jgi:hypothetical protein
MFTTAARNAMLGGFSGTHLSLHTAWHATGGNEVTGGSPAYTREAVTYGAASGEARTASGTPTFDVPAGTTVRFIGMWDDVSAGNFLGMIPNGGDELEFSIDATADTVKSPAHGLVDNDKIVFIGDTTPGGITQGTVYFVISAATDTFQVSATQGGSAINLTTEPGRKCVVSKIIEEAFAAQGTFAVSPHVIRLDA